MKDYFSYLEVACLKCETTLRLQEGRWALIIQRVTYLSGYLNGWQITGILCLLTISILVLLGTYALFIYLLELFRTQRALAAAARASAIRRASLEKAMAAFRAVNYGPGEGEYSEEDQCPICRDDYEVGHELSCAPCGHVFHYQCLLDSMTTSEDAGRKLPTCPLCRAELIHGEHTHAETTGALDQYFL